MASCFVHACCTSNTQNKIARTSNFQYNKEETDVVVFHQTFLIFKCLKSDLRDHVLNSFLTLTVTDIMIAVYGMK